MKRLLALGLVAICLACALPLTACTPQQKLYSASWFDMFDTVTMVQGYAASQEEWDTQADALHDDLEHYHQLFDIYHHYDGMVNLYDVNARAGQEPVQVSRELFDFLQLCKTSGETLAGGAVNIAAGAVLSLWHDARESENPAPPAADAISEALQHCNLDDLLLDSGTLTVAFSDPAMTLDVGAAAKGYTAVQAGQAARERGLTHALLNMGGNVYTTGPKADGSAWRVGVENPWPGEDAPQYVQTVELTGGDSLIVSGDYQRYFTYEGKRYSHLIDLTTGCPAAYYSSVAVYSSPDEGLGDLFSTALFCLPPEQSRQVADDNGLAVLWLGTDGEVAGQTDNWPGKAV